MSRIRRTLSLLTSLEPNAINYTLQATIPAHMLTKCAASLPRPSWEPILYYSTVCIMGFILFCVLVAGYFEADRIFAADINKWRARNCFDKSKILDFKTIAGVRPAPLPGAEAANGIPASSPTTAPPTGRGNRSSISPDHNANCTPSEQGPPNPLLVLNPKCRKCADHTDNGKELGSGGGLFIIRFIASLLSWNKQPSSSPSPENVDPRPKAKVIKAATSGVKAKANHSSPSVLSVSYVFTRVFKSLSSYFMRRSNSSRDARPAKRLSSADLKNPVVANGNMTHNTKSGTVAPPPEGSKPLPSQAPAAVHQGSRQAVRSSAAVGLTLDEVSAARSQREDDREEDTSAKRDRE